MFSSPTSGIVFPHLSLFPLRFLIKPCLSPSFHVAVCVSGPRHCAHHISLIHPVVLNAQQAPSSLSFKQPAHNLIPSWTRKNLPNAAKPRCLKVCPCGPASCPTFTLVKQLIRPCAGRGWRGRLPAQDTTGAGSTRGWGGRGGREAPPLEPQGDAGDGRAPALDSWGSPSGGALSLFSPRRSKDKAGGRS